MEILNEKEIVIFKSAQTLLNVSTELREINSDVSQAVLFLSDRLLKAIETNDVVEERPTNVCSDELCPDCGGIKQDNIIILDEPNIESPIKSVDESKGCNGHQAGGPQAGKVGGSNASPNNFVSENIKTEIRGLIDEIRGTL